MKEFKHCRVFGMMESGRSQFHFAKIYGLNASKSPVEGRLYIKTS